MSSGVAVYEAIEDGKDFVFKDFNRAAERIENISRDRMLTRIFADLLCGDEAAGFVPFLVVIAARSISYGLIPVAGMKRHYVIRFDLINRQPPVNLRLGR